MTRTPTRQHLLIGAAALALLGGGVALGAVLFGGERAELHADHEDEHDDDADDAHVEGEIEIDEASIRAAGIVLIEATVGSLGAEIVAQGSITSTPDGEAVLTAGASGSVAEIRKRLGDEVKRGETIAVVSSPEAAGLAATRSSAKAQLDLAQAHFDREQKLFDARVTARQDLETAQAQLDQARAEHARSEAAARAARVAADGRSVIIASPIDGRITSVGEAARLGAYVAPETLLFHIADPLKLQVEAVVPSLDLARIQPGDAAMVEGAGGVLHAATVRAVTPGVDAASRTASVVLTLNEQTAMHPGQYARVLIRPAAAASDDRFVLPEEAVQSVEAREVVFVRTNHGFVAAPVRTGERGGGRIEIVEGLEAGQIVAARKAFLLKAELGKGEAGHDH